MKRCFMLILVLVLFLFSACVPERETSEAPLESMPDRITAPSEDPLATEKWETTTKENGDSVLRKFTKEYNDGKDNYTLTAMKYTNGEHTEKIITVYTDGKKTHDEVYRYDGDTLIYSNKSDYTSDISVPAFSHTYSIVEHDSGYAYYESEMHFSEDGAITEGFQTNYNEDGTTHSTEEISQKELDGYVCRYSVITNYENNIAIGISHLAYDKNMDYWYREKRTAENELLYTRKDVNDLLTVTFPNVGAYAVSGIEYEFFDADGRLFAKARLENMMFNIYEISEGVSTQDAVDTANVIITKAREYGF